MYCASTTKHCCNATRAHRVTRAAAWPPDQWASPSGVERKSKTKSPSPINCTSHSARAGLLKLSNAAKYRPSSCFISTHTHKNARRRPLHGQAVVPQQPREPAIAVHEGVDEDEAETHQRRLDQRRNVVLGVRHAHQPVDQGQHVLRRRWNIADGQRAAPATL